MRSSSERLQVLQQTAVDVTLAQARVLNFTWGTEMLTDDWSWRNKRWGSLRNTNEPTYGELSTRPRPLRRDGSRRTMDKGRRVAIYARVSTDGQTTDNQLRELVAAAQRHGWVVTVQYLDKGISGAKGREARPAFHAMCQARTTGI